MTKIPKGRSTVRDLFTVLSGTAGAQVVGLLILPFLARVFAPEAFGIFQLYLSVLVFCTVAIALRIELTLLSKPDAEVHQTAETLFGLVIATSLIISFFLSIYSTFGRDLGFPIAFLGLGLVGSGFSQVASYKLIRDQQFSRLALVKVSQVLVYSVVALTISLIHPVLWGILIADVVGRLASGAIALQAVRRSGTPLAGALRLRALPPFVRRHWELAVFSLPGALANSAGAMLTPFMIFHVFGVAAAGQYGLVDRAMGVPVAMLVNAGSQVFAGRVTEQVRIGNSHAIRHLLVRIVGLGALVCGIGAAVGYLLIPTAFPLIFGPRWSQAIDLARIMIFAYAVTLVTGIINQTLVSLGAYRLQSAWDVCWPLFIGMAWIAVVAFKLDLHTAVMLHAGAVASLGAIFILLCLARLQGGVPTARAREA